MSDPIVRNDHLYVSRDGLIRPRAEHPFYWQREKGWMLDEHGDKIPMTVSEMLELFFSGFSTRPDEYEKWEKDRRKRWCGENGWTPREWVELLERLDYKPGWHVQIILRPDPYRPTMALEFETLQTLPNGVEQRLGLTLRIVNEFVRDEDRAMDLIYRGIEEMEHKIFREWLRRDGQKYQTPREKANA